MSKGHITVLDFHFWWGSRGVTLTLVNDWVDFRWHQLFIELMVLSWMKKRLLQVGISLKLGAVSLLGVMYNQSLLVKGDTRGVSLHLLGLSVALRIAPRHFGKSATIGVSGETEPVRVRPIIIDYIPDTCSKCFKLVSRTDGDVIHWDLPGDLSFADDRCKVDIEPIIYFCILALGEESADYVDTYSALLNERIAVFFVPKDLDVEDVQCDLHEFEIEAGSPLMFPAKYRLGSAVTPKGHSVNIVFLDQGAPN